MLFIVEGIQFFMIQKTNTLQVNTPETPIKTAKVIPRLSNLSSVPSQNK